ncbi:ribonuclease H-like domain-containing protein, partial [Tanacetum coccineum]
SDGSFERYKAHLVGDGRSQQVGVDCDETFSLVVKPATIRTTLSLAVSKSKPIHQLDVKNAFFHVNPIILCLFTTRKDLAYLLLYVDDIILTTSPDSLCHSIITLLDEFAIKDLGPLSYFLGVGVKRHDHGLFLSQSKYVVEIIKRASMSSCKPSHTPVDTKPKLSSTFSAPYSIATQYRSLAGALQYLTFTRHVISYFVQQICLHMHDPHEAHMIALKPILRYIQDTLHYGSHLYQSSSSTLVSYTDVDWGATNKKKRFGDLSTLMSCEESYGTNNLACEESLLSPPKHRYLFKSTIALEMKEELLGGSQVTYLLIYVDDIILTASSPALLQQIIDSLHNEFDMTDLRALNYFLGISADRTSTGLFLSRRKYALQLLERAHMVHCNPSRTPVDTESKLGPKGVPIQDPTLYHSLAGGLQYLTFTHPDLSYAVQQLYASATTSLVGYTDDDWAGCPSTHSSEVEYRGVANVVAKTAWLRNLLRELHSPLSTATLVYYDNVSAVYMSANPVQHQRTKHIKINIHFVRDMVTAGQTVNLALLDIEDSSLSMSSNEENMSIEEYP